MKLRLVSISLPENGEMEAIGIQNKLFREFGFTSAICLPVFIPLLFIDSSLSGKEAIRSLSIPRFGFRIECARLAEEGGFFFLQAEPASKIELLRNTILARDDKRGESVHSENEQALIPLSWGIFLGCNENQVPLDSVRNALHPIPRIRFSSLSITITDIEIQEQGSAWWKNISWEIIFEKRLAKNQPED